MQPSPNPLPSRPAAAVVLFVTLAAFAGLALAPAAAHAAKEPKKRVAVTAFENRASYAGYNSRELGAMGRAMAEKLIEELINTGKFVVLERLALADVLEEQNLDSLAPVKPIVDPRLTSAQALIRGVVTDIDSTEGGRGGLRLGKMRVGGKGEKVRVKVNIRIIDVVTGQILESKSVEGIAKARGLNFVSSMKNVGVDAAGESNVPVSDAADDAVVQAVDKIIAGMESVSWQGSVARVSGGQIFINAGQQENVEPGLRLRVFEKGKDLIDVETNENLGSLDEEIGVIEIEEVAARFSIARILEGQGFAPGNIVKPVESF